MSGNRCRRCRNKKWAKTNEQFTKEVYDLVGNEYTFLEEYKVAREKIKVRHNTCGAIYETTPNNFLRGNRCRKCQMQIIHDSQRMTQEEFEEMVSSLTGDEYTFLEKYIGTDYPISVRHNTCGHEYTVRPSNFKRGARCPQCAIKIIAEKNTLTQEEFDEKVFCLVGNDYTFLEPYNGHRGKIRVRHNICGHEYEVTPNNFLRNRRCPSCTSPETEKIVEAHLSYWD